ncbi:MAG: L-histidine N(alpha)-methyltransferase [Ectothiorhodospiraceae bacterium]|nr:L-histidine N(alpha)-methyltransferase [Ectothiorhodospiraceae bacterium]
MSITVDAEHQVQFEELLVGLSADRKWIPCKYFYDERGSELFEQITQLDEYYPTRTEIAIMHRNIEEIAAELGPECLLIEYGSGSSIKIRLLIEHLNELAAYVPIEISADHLEAVSNQLRDEYEDLRIIPIAADYTKDFELPEFGFPYSHKVVYFPGSTIGNFTTEEAREFLKRIATVAGKDGGLLIGVDLQKDKAILEPAYDDAKGVTAEFNKNVLVRLNKEFNADFDVDEFSHLAEYNADEGRIEIYLVSDIDQTANIEGKEIAFTAGEKMLTEYSCKYTLDSFAELVEGIFNVKHVWTDKQNLFSIQYLTVA